MITKNFQILNVGLEQRKAGFVPKAGEVIREGDLVAISVDGNGVTNLEVSDGVTFIGVALESNVIASSQLADQSIVDVSGYNRGGLISYFNGVGTTAKLINTSAVAGTGVGAVTMFDATKTYTNNQAIYFDGTKYTNVSTVTPAGSGETPITLTQIAKVVAQDTVAKTLTIQYII